ncbi:hypothetical protein O3G_MSEX014710 [Manduca sexta]|uniref:Uncharacterized protein n=1 Tax=Manduca sexta TaxID=7130 RepID=A0A921ZW92_MANSE|nr:hypothetical protein O3G_MSEX014710 [Manduca sexta]
MSDFTLLVRMYLTNYDNIVDESNFWVIFSCLIFMLGTYKMYRLKITFQNVMWRVGVCLVVLASLAEAQQPSLEPSLEPSPEHGILLHRLKRHHHHYCDSDYGPPPPPPPPPFWPPPPPPYWGRRRHFWPPPPPPLPPIPPPPRYEDYEKPCDTCGEGHSGAVSNAQSNTGEAIAVAIAKARKD